MFFPNISHFNSDNFAKCPIDLIEKALESIYLYQLNQSNFNSVAIANLGCALLKAQGVKRPEQDWINPFPKLLEKREAKASFDVKVAKTFMELATHGKIPRWVFSEFPSQVKLIRNCEVL